MVPHCSGGSSFKGTKTKGAFCFGTLIMYCVIMLTPNKCQEHTSLFADKTDKRPPFDYYTGNILFFQRVSIFQERIKQILRQTLALSQLQEEHSLPFIRVIVNCVKIKNALQQPQKKYATLHLQLSVMMCRMDFWSSKHHTTRMRTQSLMLSPAQWASSTLLFVRSVHTQLPSPLFSLRPAVHCLPLAQSR